jgi:hypothetical protein
MTSSRRPSRGTGSGTWACRLCWSRGSSWRSGPR